MFRWYVVNTYSGHENKVKANLEHRIESMGQRVRFRRVVVPTEQVIETKDGQKVQAEKRVLPGLRAREHGPERRRLDGRQEHAGRDRLRRRRLQARAAVAARGRPHPEDGRERRPATAPARQVEFSLGESVKVTSGPLSDFDGEIVDVNPDQQKLKVLVDIFERQVPVELAFDQVKKLD